MFILGSSVVPSSAALSVDLICFPPIVMIGFGLIFWLK